MKKNITEQEAFLQLAALCAQAEHCEQEMRDKLKRWELDTAAADRIIVRLQKERYIDDARYARAFVKDKIRYNKWGRRKVEQALWQKRIADDIPVVMLNSKDGHSGTYYEKYGGNYAKAVVKWLDWQLKGQVGQSALFLDDEYLKMKFPEWQGVRKNW
jgi:hypothetical protein